MNNTEPVVSANIIAALVSAVVVLAIAFGAPLTEAQQAAIMGFTVVAAPLIAAWWARRRVTPLILPTDVDGARLSRPDNSPAIPEMANLQAEALKMNTDYRLTLGQDNL